ncbi:MAG: proton-conducting transporter transmembrane domain-containing protein [Candidatus Nitrosocosmicus sp.]
MYFFFIIRFLGTAVGLFLCLSEIDGKLVVAYSSVVHMRLVFFNFLILNLKGLERN